MVRIRICALLAVVSLCLQPFSFSQTSIGAANLGQAELSADPIVDVHGNVLFFRTIVSKSNGVQTEVTLISPTAATAVQTYPGILSPIKRGEQAVYAIQRVPAASVATTPTPATLNLVALATTPGSLPQGLIDYSLSGKFDSFTIDSGFLTGGADVIYLGQYTSTGASVLVLTFTGSGFTAVGSPVPLP